MAKQIKIHFDNNATITCDVAVTYEARQKGLRRFPTLEEKHGLLFIYEDMQAPPLPLFWNKGVLYDIEILYLGQDMKIAGVNFLKAGSSDVAMTKVPTKYIVEVPAGTLERLSLNVSSQITSFED